MNAEWHEHEKKFFDKMSKCKNMIGYFTNNDGNNTVAYIEHVKAKDERYIAEGITDYFVAHHILSIPVSLWSEVELYDYLNKNTWAWTFHPGKVVA